MSSDNIITIASAGSGKSTSIVENALLKENDQVLITTFTVECAEELKKIIIEKVKTVPKNIIIMTWMSFLIQECIRPYQLVAYGTQITRPVFIQGRSAIYSKRTDYKHFFNSNGDIYSDKLSEFACLCDEKSQGKVITRLEKVFKRIYIDEFQDFAGYDFELVKKILSSNIRVKIVADPRQGTYSTNESAKNGKYKKSGVKDLIELLEKNKLCTIELNNWSYRCNQMICSIADKLYPEFEPTISKNIALTGHDGVFVVKERYVDDYIKKYKPVALRYDKKTKWQDEKIKNFGAVKGRTYDRVLILPNGPILDFLSGRNFKSPAKYYVGFTRARFSVAILYDDQVSIEGINEWKYEV
jgi:DNA helicase-2/ATP-dependent DNA helicase PcrA